MHNHLRPRAIIHLDMDAFFPAVEALDNPELKGKPLIVGGGIQRGVVSSASYEAREFGVHSAQPMTTAHRLCPCGIFLPVRMSRYKKASKQIFEIFNRFTSLVEPLSIDEAFLDVTGSERLLGQPEDIAKKIKQTVSKEIGLTVSAGVAPSKFVAKIASDIDKPDGLTVVPHDSVKGFLDPLPIKRMWGVGKATQKALDRLGVRTFRDLTQISPEVLKQKFGKNGVKMHFLARGIDERDVVPKRDVKSISHEETFPQDILDMNLAKKALLSLSHKVARRTHQEGLTGKTVTLKVKYYDFSQITRSMTLFKATDDGFEIYSTACRLLEKTEVGKRPVRLLGIFLSQVTQIGPEEQLSLFQQGKELQKRKRLNKALGSLYEKHGENSVRPGTLFTP